MRAPNLSAAVRAASKAARQRRLVCADDSDLVALVNLHAPGAKNDITMMAPILVHPTDPSRTFPAPPSQSVGAADDEAVEWGWLWEL